MDMLHSSNKSDAHSLDRIATHRMTLIFTHSSDRIATHRMTLSHPMSEPAHHSIMKNTQNPGFPMLHSLRCIRILAALYIRYLYNYAQRGIRIKAGVC